MLSRRAINACHVTCQRQMELDRLMVLDAPLCPSLVRSVFGEVPSGQNSQHRVPISDERATVRVSQTLPEQDVFS